MYFSFSDCVSVPDDLLSNDEDYYIPDDLLSNDEDYYIPDDLDSNDEGHMPTFVSTSTIQLLKEGDTIRLPCFVDKIGKTELCLF